MHEMRTDEEYTGCARALTRKPLSQELSAIRTLPEIFAWRAARTPRAAAYREYEDASGRWVEVTWDQMKQRVSAVRAALSRLALPRQARVAILLPNGLHAVCVDQAVLALGFVPVPMHALDNPDSIAYIIGDSDASVLVAASDVQWRAIAETRAAMPALRLVVVIRREARDAPTAGMVPILSLEQWLADSQDGLPDASGSAPDANDLAALVYTSGTTGKPKGVMLTHDNVVSNVKAAMERMAPQSSDVFLSFLPLSHTFERTAGYYLPIAAACCVAFSRSVKQLPEDMKVIRPTVLVSVPRIYERVFAALQTALSSSSVKCRLFTWAQAVGWRRFRRAQGLLSDGRTQSVTDTLLWPLLDRLIARPVRGQFGGRLRLAVSGGAALSQSVAQCFLGLGLPIVQGYGMTETSPIIAANGLDDNDPATVGRPLPGVEVQIGENHELLVRGPNVMRGYWKRDQDTAQAFSGGWLRTGDQAAIEGGRLRILGRVKEIIVTSTGEKIAPVDIELAVTSDRSFESAYAFGDDRPFIGCVVVLSRDYWDDLARRLRLNPEDPNSLGAAPAKAAALQRVRDLTRGLPFYAQPRAIVLSLEAWTIENSLITPTLKLKRKNLAAHFDPQITALYSATTH